MSPDKIQTNNIKRQIDLVVCAADELPDYALRYLVSVLAAQMELKRDIQWRSDQANTQSMLKAEAEKAANNQPLNNLFMGGELRRA